MHVLNILIDNLDIQLQLNVWVEILFYPFDARLIVMCCAISCHLYNFKNLKEEESLKVTLQMGVFHLFEIVQMVSSRAKHLTLSLLSGMLLLIFSSYFPMLQENVTNDFFFVKLRLMKNGLSAEKKLH